jgi:hypothetical protein
MTLMTLRQRVVNADPTWGEALVAAVAIVFGLWISYPGFETFPTSSGYAWMHRHGTEMYWGLGMTCVGMLQAVGIAGRIHHRVLHLITTALAMAMWEFLILVFALSDLRTAAIPVFSLYWISLLLALLRRYG